MMESIGSTDRGHRRKISKPQVGKRIDSLVVKSSANPLLNSHSSTQQTPFKEHLLAFLTPNYTASPCMSKLPQHSHQSVVVQDDFLSHLSGGHLPFHVRSSCQTRVQNFVLAYIYVCACGVCVCAMGVDVC